MAAGAQPSPDPVLPAVPGMPLGASLAPHPSPCPTSIPLPHGCIQCPVHRCSPWQWSVSSTTGARIPPLPVPRSTSRSVRAGEPRRCWFWPLVSTSSTVKAQLKVLNPDMSQTSEAQVSLPAVLKQAAASGENAKKGMKTRD